MTAASGPDSPEDAEPTYLEALAELDEILDGLEDDEVDVDRLAHQVRRAHELIRLCQDRLTASRLEIEEISAALDS